jgi:hypothetical protein
VVSFVELLFGVVNFGRDDVCGTGKTDGVMQLPTWVIVNSLIEIIIVCLLLSYNISSRGILRLYSLYIISMVYFSWLVVGFYLLCEQCITGEKPEGVMFILICLLAGMILCLLNLRVIDFLDHVRYTVHSLEIPLHRNDYL